MNDRFKFRVWDKQDECYAYSNNSDVDMLYLETDGTLTYGIWNEDYEDMFYKPESEVIVEQCTGLKDKNGKLIYEGDIVIKDKQTFEVYYDDSLFGYYLRSNNIVTVFVSYTELEVIGNIRENPELLEVQDDN